MTRTISRLPEFRTHLFFLLGLYGMYLLFTGCGYHLVGTGAGSLPDDVKVIAVLPVEGRFPRPEVQQRFTQSLVDAFVARTGRKIQTQEKGADAVVRTVVQNFQVTPIGWDENRFINRYQLVVILSIEFHRVSKEKEKGEILFKANGWTYRTQFTLETAVPENYADTELLALDQVGEEMTRSIVSAILEGF